MQPDSGDAEDAHETLANTYILIGRYKDAVHQLDEVVRIKPENADAKNVRAIFTAWGKHHNQSNGRAFAVFGGSGGGGGYY